MNDKNLLNILKQAESLLDEINYCKCTCHEDYLEIGRIDPNCCYHEWICEDWTARYNNFKNKIKNYE